MNTTMDQRTQSGHSLVRAIGAMVIIASAATASAQNRTIDGTGNNMSHGVWGSTNQHLDRVGPAAYADGMSMPAGGSRPSARAVSNGIAAQTGSIVNDRMLSDWVWQWGQFLDHDLDLTDAASPAESFPIPVPMGDPFFDPFNTGTQTIPLSRSAYDPVTGSINARQQMNQITSWIDASNVYGSDMTRANALRTMSGGRLATSAGDLLPFNTGGLPNAGGTSASLFLAGDIRSNEQSGLAATHTLFVREHNRLADQIATANPGMNDEDIYQQARKIVGAQLQVITYNEFLPALLGSAAPSPMSIGYDDSINPNIMNEFANACYRVGHTMLSPTILRLDNAGNVIPQGNLALQDAFFNPNNIINGGGIDPILKGLASQAMQEIDNQIVDDVRNFLFGPPGSGGMDLASLNIQRGRDHGLPDYNSTRVMMGLTSVSSFADISSDPAVQAALMSLYGTVNDIDLWVGALAEDHLAGSSVGELIAAVLSEQFMRLRDGDRYWYERDDFFVNNPSLLAELQATRLSDIIRRNSDITNIQDNVFLIPEPATLGLLVFGGLLLRERRR
ncbi:MAG: peroxiredoxin [Planctomycetia bacterium]|nr:peroxiredoxin [Planctomycetia bacterium]MCC7313220.1 peroxiredoxin [Planctomycetota bacterium]